MIKYIHGGVIRGGMSSGAIVELPPNWEEAIEQKIMADDAAAEDYFGNSVAISGDGMTAIVSANGVDEGGDRAGAAYIFTNNEGTWTQQQKLVASDAQELDYFGSSVSMSGDGMTAIVGAGSEDAGGTNAGAAYIFTRSGDIWTEQSKIVASDAQKFDVFGISVSISGDGMTAIVGAYLEDAGGTDAGAAYIFTNNEGTWAEQQKIVAGDAQAGDYFGYSVSISGDGMTAIVGAYLEDAGGTDAGAAYIFTNNEGTWTQQQKIMAGDAEADDRFGWSVSISGDGNAAIVGAYKEATGGEDAGAAYIFTSNEGAWVEQQKIMADDADANDRFGGSVSISSDGTTAIVGAHYEDTSGTYAGAAYIFTNDAGTWTQQSKIIASDAEAIDYFGESVSISGDGMTAIVGSFTEDTSGTDAGAAYIYQA